jgi:hypothetical protein
MSFKHIYGFRAHLFSRDEMRTVADRHLRPEQWYFPNGSHTRIYVNASEEQVKALLRELPSTAIVQDMISDDEDGSSWIRGRNDAIASQAASFCDVPAPKARAKETPYHEDDFTLSYDDFTALAVMDRGLAGSYARCHRELKACVSYARKRLSELEELKAVQRKPANTGHVRDQLQELIAKTRGTSTARADTGEAFG